MAQPQKPPNLDPNHIYVHITSPSSPSSIANAATSEGESSLRYVGPVGELQGEHIFEVLHRGEPAKRDLGPTGLGERAVAALKAVEVIKGAKVLEVKQRSKRGGEL